MNILIIEPFYTSSHKAWADGWKAHSKHQIDILSLPGRFWKWRMYGGAVSLAEQFNHSKLKPDLIVATDMLDLNVFLSLTHKKIKDTPVYIYFHENQLTYPWSATDSSVVEKWDRHYAFKNYASALAADRVLFNSAYHKNSFIEALPKFLDGFPDYKLKDTLNNINAKSQTLHLGLDLGYFDQYNDGIEKEGDALILWNHRWEYDKGPEKFFQVLMSLKEKGIRFNLAVLGESYEKKPDIFAEAKEVLKDHIVHWGYTQSREEYAHWLHKADILPVTSHQDFFGGSVVEAMYCDTVPLLPKRLAYPEHIPEDLHPTFFYEDIQDLEKRLQKLIINIKIIRKQNIMQYVASYDWKSIISRYDALILE